jgi:hypothetical protein
VEVPAIATLHDVYPRHFALTSDVPVCKALNLPVHKRA